MPLATASFSHLGSPSEDPDRVKPSIAAFNEPERVELINKIAGALNTLNETKIKTFTTCYACLWLADIEKLQDLVDLALPDNGKHHALRIYDKFFRVELEGKIGQNWHQKDQHGESVDSHQGSRIQSARDACYNRDKTCILTKCNGNICQPCPLYPFWMNDRNMIEMPSDLKRLENLILLSPNAYALYTKKYIGLEPVDRDLEGKWLTLRIWWLKQREEECVDFRAIPQLPPDFHPSNYVVALHDVRSDRPVLSGDTIMLETHDPENYPLPDPRILGMQWILNLVLALRGTAEPNDMEDDEWDEDSDEVWT